MNKLIVGIVVCGFPGKHQPLRYCAITGKQINLYIQEAVRHVVTDI